MSMYGVFWYTDCSAVKKHKAFLVAVEEGRMGAGNCQKKWLGKWDSVHCMRLRLIGKTQ